MKRRRIGRILIGLAVAGIVMVLVISLMMSRASKVDKYASIRDQIAIDDARSVSYIRGGDSHAPRIIYVHGSPGSAGDFASYVVHPVDGFEAISIDRFGFGYTTPKSPTPSLVEQAKAIEPFLVERNGQWPILVGHSLGGTIVCQAAVDYPDRVGGIVIVSGALDPALEKVQWFQQLAEFWFVPSILPELIVNSNRELIPLKAELEALQPRLATIQCPVAILHGDNDWLVPVANVEFMKENIPQDRIVDHTILNGANHFLPWTNEADIRRCIGAVSAHSAIDLP